MNKIKYDVLIFNLESVFSLANEVVTKDQMNLFKIRYADLDSLYNEFHELHLLLASDIGEGDDSAEKYMERFKEITNNYYITKAKYLELFPQSDTVCSGQDLGKGRSGLDYREAQWRLACRAEHDSGVILPSLKMTVVFFAASGRRSGADSASFIIDSAAVS
ncbi:hypothetical protein ACJJTC_011966 [Scirpophaga incertulas]